MIWTDIDIVKVPISTGRNRIQNFRKTRAVIFSKLKKRFAVEEKPLGYVEQMRCVCIWKFTIDDIESPITIDTSAEEWIKK